MKVRVGEQEVAVIFHVGGAAMAFDVWGYFLGLIRKRGGEMSFRDGVVRVDEAGDIYGENNRTFSFVL